MTIGLDFLSASVMAPLISSGFVFMLSLGLTYFVILYAKKLGLLMDVPDERSSHLKPNPRGGGVAIVATLVISYLVFNMGLDVSEPLIWALLGCGGSAAVIGWIDDHRSISPWRRLTAYLGICVIAVMILGPIQTLTFGSYTLGLNIFAYPVTIAGLLWMLNLYNFMDGIDGQATLTGIFVCGAILLMTSCGVIHCSRETTVYLALFVTFAGFLPWNFPPARIFLGDVGSCFIGFTFGALMIDSARAGGEGGDPILLWTWLILLCHFIVDASLTLMLRMARGEQWSQPHRKHLFHRILKIYEMRYMKKGYAPEKMRRLSHLQVNKWIQGANCLLVLPCAFAAQSMPAYAPIIFGGLLCVYSGVLLYVDAKHP